jgi:hypothetical protein
MPRFPLRLFVIALLLASVAAPTPAAAAQTRAPFHGALAALASPGGSLARILGWVAELLPGYGHDQAPAKGRPAGGNSGLRIRPDDGAGADPNG